MINGVRLDRTILNRLTTIVPALTGVIYMDLNCFFILWMLLLLVCLVFECLACRGDSCCFVFFLWSRVVLVLKTLTLKSACPFSDTDFAGCFKASKKNDKKTQQPPSPVSFKL